MNEPDPAIARAMHYVRALADRVATDPDRPVCHFLPPSRWMNDPNGTIRHSGWYQCFHQLNPFGDSWGFMHWGHARSRDLVHWEHLPIALPRRSNWAKSTASPAVLRSTGTARLACSTPRFLFPTSHPSDSDNGVPRRSTPI